MNDKEMAEEYTVQFGFGSDCNNITSHDANEAIVQAFFVGLREGRREKWHDLRKDPNDLPKPTTTVLVILESGVPYVSWISSDKGWWFCTNYYIGEDKVIAWCEIPTFDKESK